ncbi:hypothetical protein, partial [Streptomyces sp. PU-14G]|uniref:hypothetical protein n=1 Tax=Streptomyces sp. PU-14G TaxID=2800808 RepID=UPI0034DE14AA
MPAHTPVFRRRGPLPHPPARPHLRPRPGRHPGPRGGPRGGPRWCRVLGAVTPFMADGQIVEDRTPEEFFT